MILNVVDKNRENYEKILKTYFEGLAVYPDSDVTVILDPENDRNAKLLSVYRIEQDSDLLFEEHGIWSKETGIELSDHRVNSRRRMDLRGKVLKAIFVVKCLTQFFSEQNFVSEILRFKGQKSRRKI